jgi:hypothetical protein
MNLSKQHDLVDLLGQYVLTESETGQMDMVWKDGKVTEAVKAGKVLILEELTMSEPTVLAALHGLFETPASLHTLEGDVEVHEDFRVICTANPSWTNYQGVSDLNYAFEDRFAHLEFGFPSEKAFLSLITPYEDNFEKRGVNLHSFYRVAKRLFEMYPDEADYYISLRGAQFFGKLLKHYSIRNALNMALLYKIPPSERNHYIDVIDRDMPVGV